MAGRAEAGGPPLVPVDTRRRRKLLAARLGRLGRHPLWPILPLIALFLAAYLYPLGRMVGDALLGVGVDGGLARLLESPVYGRALLRTFGIAGLVTVATLLVAYPFAAFMAAQPRNRQALLLAIVFTPLLTSVVVRTYVWLAVVRPSGVLDGLAGLVGLAPVYPLVYQTDLAVVIGLLHVMMPFAVLPLYAGFLRLDPELRRAAASLGAGTLAQWRRVLLPLTMPSLVGAAVLVFVTSIGFVVTPAILGGPRAMMVGVLVQRLASANDVPFAAFLSLVLLATTLLVLCLMPLVLARFRARGML